MRIVMYCQIGMTETLAIAPDLGTALANPPSCVKMILPYSCTDITDQIIALHDQLHLVRTKKVPKIPAPDKWSPWIAWNGGDCPIYWAKAGEYEVSGVPHRGEAYKHLPANDYRWRHIRGGENIVAYRYLLSIGRDDSQKVKT